VEDFTMKTVLPRFKKLGDLWAPLLAQKGRTRLDKFL
jgi:DNA primase